MTIIIDHFDLPENIQIMRDGKLVDIPREQATRDEWLEFSWKQIDSVAKLKREAKAWLYLTDQPKHGTMIVFPGGDIVEVPPEAINDKNEIKMTIRPMEPDELSAKQRRLDSDKVIEFEGGKTATVPISATLYREGDVVMSVIACRRIPRVHLTNQPATNQPSTNQQEITA